MVFVRVRLRFDSSPLHYAKKCWFTFDADQCNLVKDVSYLIASQFDLNHDLQLYMDDFLIPVDEDVHVIRDNDLICVKAVECESSNTSMVLSDDVQSPKAKRRKSEKSEDKSKPKISKPSSSSSRATVKEAKAFLSDTKIGESSSKHQPPTERLRAVTKKSSTGATHTTFHSSSSSSSSETESSSSESSESDKEVGRAQEKKKLAGSLKQTVADKVNTGGLGSSKRVLQTPSNSLKVPPLGSGKVEAKKQAATNTSSNKRRARTRKRKLSSNLTVGGSNDVFTTKSTLYKSPKQSKSADKNPSQNSHQTFNGDKSSDSESGKAKKTATSDGVNKTEKPPSQWDVKPGVPPNQSVVPPQQALALPPPRDYSVLPELQGPPRQGDRLAFKVLELSSSYEPIFSEYKEATVQSYDATTKTINIEYSKETLMKCKAKDSGKTGRFEMHLDEDEDEPELVNCAQIKLDSLIEPKLIT